MLGGGATDIGSQSAKEEYAKEFEKSREEILRADALRMTGTANAALLPSPLEAYRVTRRTAFAGSLCITKREGNNNVTAISPFTSHVSRAKRSAAFTLAEVLITLGIIGIVAAMTMPTLIQKHQEKVTVTKLKKIYSILQQSYLYAVEEYGTPDEWGLGSREDDTATEEDPDKVASSAVIIRDKLFSHVKKVKKCDSSSKVEECNIASKYYFESGSEDRPLLSAYNGLSIIDGSNLLILVTDPNCTYNRGSGKYLSHDCAFIDIDLNGKNPPNTWGKDLFGFYLTKYGIIPVGTPDETYYPFGEGHYGLGRTAWVIFNENMDYLKCPSELSWNGKKTCK